MPTLKNRGPLLTNKQVGGEAPIPPEFIAAMNRIETDQKVDNDVDLVGLSDTIVECRLVAEVTGERKLVTVFKKAGNITLLWTNTNDQGQPVQITRTLLPTGSSTASSSATKSISVKDLGNGWSLEEVSEEGSYVDGVFVPGIFTNELFSRERPNLVPERFRPQIPTVTHRVDSVGTAVDPTLTGDELSESQEQITADKKRVTISTQAMPTLPVSLTAYETNQDKQLATILEKYKVTGAPSVTITATRDVKVQNLGDGRQIETVTTIPEVFDRAGSTNEITDGIPQRFQFAYPQVTTTSTFASIAPAPEAVGDGISGVLRSQSERTDEFTGRVSTTTRDVPTGAGLSAFTTTNEFGGGIVTSGELFDLTVNLVDPPEFNASLLTYSQNQVNQNYSVRKTEVMDSFPLLVGTEIEPNGLQINITKQVQGAGVTGTVYTGGFTEARPLDWLRTEVTNHEVDSLPNPYEIRKQVVDLVPQRFLVGIPVTTTITRVATNVVTPDALGGGVTGITESSVERVSVFENRKSKQERTVTLPINHVGKKVTTQFGGGVLVTQDQLTSAEPTVDGGLLVLEAESQQIATSLWDYQDQVLEAEEWPVLYGTLTDDTIGIAIPFTKQVVPAGTEGSVVGNIYTEVQPVDKWRSIKIVVDASGITLPTSDTYPVTYNVKDPDDYVGDYQTATSGSVYDESRSFGRFAGYDGPKLCTCTEGYTNAAGLAAIVVGLTGRRISVGNSTPSGNTYAVTGDREFARTFSYVEPTADFVEGTVLAFMVDKMKYGIYRYRLIVE